MSVMSGEPAKTSGKAPAASATARRLRSPTRCAGNLPSIRCKLPITPTTGFLLRVTLRAQPWACASGSGIPVTSRTEKIVIAGLYPASMPPKSQYGRPVRFAPDILASQEAAYVRIR